MRRTAPAPAKPTKTCPRCKVVKFASEFYPDKYTKDRLNCYCKPCAKQKGLQWRYAKPENAEKANEGFRKWYATHVKENTEKCAAYQARNPEKVYARSLMSRAIRAGKLIRQPCEKCGAPKAQGHHHDYAKPLEVHWMCARCHGMEHRWTPEGVAAREQGR